MPESMHRSICRRASAALVVPTLVKGSLPPKVMVPMVMVEPFKPERPSVRYSMGIVLRFDGRAEREGRCEWHGKSDFSDKYSTKTRLRIVASPDSTTHPLRVWHEQSYKRR